jgi:hypothetical protein
VFGLVPILIVLSVAALTLVYVKFLARDLARRRELNAAGAGAPAGP